MARTHGHRRRSTALSRISRGAPMPLHADRRPDVRLVGRGPVEHGRPDGGLDGDGGRHPGELLHRPVRGPADRDAYIRIDHRQGDIEHRRHRGGHDIHRDRHLGHGNCAQGDHGRVGG